MGKQRCHKQLLPAPANTLAGPGRRARPTQQAPVPQMAATPAQQPGDGLEVGVEALARHPLQAEHGRQQQTAAEELPLPQRGVEGDAAPHGDAADEEGQAAPKTGDVDLTVLDPPVMSIGR